MEPDELKPRLRAELRARRDALVAGLDTAGQAFDFRRAPTPLKALFASSQVVAGYVAVGSEADPAALLEQAHAQGAIIALPYVERRSVPMRFLSWTPGQSLVTGPYGLSQPDRTTAEEVAPDLFLAPLLGFDRRLHRLGQGAGFYDRAFARYPDAVRVGMAWSVQEVEMVPQDPWDVPLHAVLTEREWIA
ncbi:5-formyltetrahydrofolate cyclo-ligase [Sphingomonas sp.]|jgi:5-formyltetrahydrofolate cyclo-ligase|uniref:5-formyltetrahydrofolate cyclo-ligase n=1 Tax=Sphingomonas sp. TaxID=28214 RepID=UPI002DEA73D3|nr:5-formyltetrahydrofolate cyclo-ligase [Sphingomonas sp.]HEV2569031.1 5-formyltetrahydrofolate cyclo-ligase [Sphingomonas sp.]